MPCIVIHGKPLTIRFTIDTYFLQDLRARRVVVYLSRAPLERSGLRGFQDLMVSQDFLDFLDWMASRVRGAMIVGSVRQVCHNDGYGLMM